VKFVDSISRIILRCVAFFVLEPRLKSGQWMIPASVLDRLRPELDDLFSMHDKAKQMFSELEICVTCSGVCCMGGYSRFTVFDHVVHLLTGLQKPPEWTYRLYPFRSYALNRFDEGLCPYLDLGKGCTLSYNNRPSVCVYWVCGKMQKVLEPAHEKMLIELRRRIDTFHWKVARALLLGGMKRKSRSKGA